MTGRPPLAVRPASIARRAGAFAIDAGVAVALAAVLTGVVLGIVLAAGASGDPARVVAAILLGCVVIGPVLLGWWVAYSAMQGGRGSIGQRALGLRLQDASSPEPIGFWRAVLRNVVWALAGSIVVGWFTPLFDRSGRRQGWHDLAARALVIDGRAPAPEAPGAAGAPAGAFGHAGLAPASVSPSYVADPYLSPAAAWSHAPAPAPAPAPATAPMTGVAPPRAPAAFAVAPAVPIAGMISQVPGVARAPEPVRPLAPASLGITTTTPLPPASTTEPLDAPAARGTAASPRLAPAAGPAPTAWAAPAGATVDEDLDSTRLKSPAIVPPPAERAALYPDAPVLAVLTWDDGTRMAVYGRTLYGRNPAPEPGAVTISVRDETLSLSKTHFEIGGDASGAWIADRHSTNGTQLVRDGGRIPLAPGVAIGLRAGDRLEFGDRSAAVGDA